MGYVRQTWRLLEIRFFRNPSRSIDICDEIRC
jgi:hypothetical protein